MTNACPTCSGPSRETTMLVCQTCGMDYGQDPPITSKEWFVKHISERTSLKPETCLDLLERGWTYVEKINKPSQWLSPIASMVEPTKRVRHNTEILPKFDEIILATRVEAEEVIDQLTILIVKNDVASVQDLYTLVGITGNFIDTKWGWSDIKEARVVLVRDGYLLNLPKPMLID